MWIVCLTEILWRPDFDIDNFTKWDKPVQDTFSLMLKSPFTIKLEHAFKLEASIFGEQGASHFLALVY